MPQSGGIDRRRWFPVTVTTPTRGTTEHRILAMDKERARRAGHSFATSFGHPKSERRYVVVGESE